mmetsp:Transcript_30968/g.66541  ORF Transcript_30968/g.66541 Transcript_30968/m.66541 type:complete len:213 (-) Transcript_30968:273-911(-)
MEQRSRGPSWQALPRSLSTKSTVWRARFWRTTTSSSPASSSARRRRSDSSRSQLAWCASEGEDAASFSVSESESEDSDRTLPVRSARCAVVSKELEQLSGSTCICNDCCIWGGSRKDGAKWGEDVEGEGGACAGALQPPSSLRLTAAAACLPSGSGTTWICRRSLSEAQFRRNVPTLRRLRGAALSLEGEELSEAASASAPAPTKACWWSGR